MPYEKSNDKNTEPGLVALDNAVQAFDDQLASTAVSAQGQSLGVEMQTDSPDFNAYRYWSFQALAAEAEHKKAVGNGENVDQANLTLLVKTTARTLYEEQWLSVRRDERRPLASDQERAILERVRSYHQLMRDVAHGGLDVPVRDLLLALDRPASMAAAMPSAQRASSLRVVGDLVHRIRHEDALTEMLEAEGYEVGRRPAVHDFIEGTLQAREPGGDWITVVLDTSPYPVEEATVIPRLYKPDEKGRRMVYFRTGLDDTAFADHFRLPDTKFDEQRGLVGSQFQEVCDRFHSSGGNPIVWRSGS